MGNCLETNMNFKVSRGAKIRNRYNQVPHLTQDTNGKVTSSQLDTTNESQGVSPSQQVTTRHTTGTISLSQQWDVIRKVTCLNPLFDILVISPVLTDTHKCIANTRQKNIKDTQKKYRLGTVSKIFYWRA